MKFLISLLLFITLQISQAQFENQFPGEVPIALPNYTPLDPSEVEANPQIQGLLYLGLQNALQQALKDGALPQANYLVSQILGYAQNLEALNTQDYKFDVELTDGENTPIITYFVSFDPSTGTSEMTSYSVIPDDYTDLDPSVVETNPQISAILNLGIQSVTELAFQDGTIPHTNYELEDANRVEQSKTNPNQYRFDIDLEPSDDADGDDVRAKFTLVYRRDIGNVEILYYTVSDDESDSDSDFENENESETDVEFVNGELEIGEETADGFVVLDPNIIETDPLIRGILFLGVQDAISQAIANGSMANATYELADVHSIEQNMENVDNYRFDVSVRNGSEETVRMDLDLLYDSTTNNVEVISFEISSIIEIAEKEAPTP